jgi:pyruvate,water dikinase
VTQLNEILPKRQFILMCPRRRFDHADGGDAANGNRGEFKNAAVLVELLKRVDYSEGAPLVDGRLLQDIVETEMLYLPLFPEDEDTHFNQQFLRRSSNLLPELLPQYAHLREVVHVIDVPMVSEGKVMRVLMNAELGEAVGMLTDPQGEIGCLEEREAFEDERPEDYWRWRYRMAEQIARLLDPGRFGVKGIYVFGSTKNGTAGPASDIDLLIHFGGTPIQREALVQWLEGWSLCLDEINYLRTGYRSGGLLDLHLITDKDIADKTSYAVKISAVTDAARPLPMNTGNEKDAVRSG